MLGRTPLQQKATGVVRVPAGGMLGCGWRLRDAVVATGPTPPERGGGACAACVCRRATSGLSGHIGDGKRAARPCT